MRLIRKLALLAACLPIVLSLPGCSATSLVHLDNEWALTYRAKMQSLKDSDDYLATASNYEVQFADLSARAAAAGDKAFPDDAPTAVGFYRIAVLAAWKSAQLSEDKVPELAGKGIAACERLPKQFASQPRDCVLFGFVDSFAAYDRKLREMDTLLAGADGPGHPLPPARLAAALTLHDDIAALFDKIGEHRMKVSELALPKSFHDYVNQNWKTVFCSTEKLRPAITDTLGVDSPKTKAVRNKDRAMQDALSAARISVNCR